MTKSQELKMALYDYLEEKPMIDLTNEEWNIMKWLGNDKEVEEIMVERFKEYRKGVK